MRKILLYLVPFLIWNALEAQNTYQNPVIPGYHPDPSICRVGDDYYLVNSSFEYFPGVPLFHSKDLVNWKQIGHCLTRESQVPLQGIAASMGIFAPTIRYHEGRFYMITTNVTKGGNFYVYTDDIHGEWSEPIYVRQGGIDPSLYFEDGKCYLVSNPNNRIMLSEIDITTGELLTEPRYIWGGTGGRYPEGPHIYKKDDWYYLLISEGGTEYGHKVTIARSRSIYGPYESNPANPILTHIDANAQTNPIQGTGHADFIQAQDGSWWVVFLAFRPQSGTHHLLGRETFLAPVQWEAGEWPVINGGEPIQLVMEAKTLSLQPFPTPATRTYFNDKERNMEWNYLRNPHPDNYLWPENGPLQLKATPVTLDDLTSPTFIGRRQQHIDFQATTSVNLKEGNKKDEAGLTVYMRDHYHYDILIKQGENGTKQVNLRYQLGNVTHIEKEIPVTSERLFLRVKGENDWYRFYYSEDDITYHEIGHMDTRLLSTETAGGFTGIMLGLYTASASSTSQAIAEIDWFDYQPLPVH
ncbi:MAG: glycoside hydrolase family 43 protein [Tannerellaceae bacterium]|nr:glycoside hydrolase family 43 protein [Tannerellaceae bacterium]